ncbi:hypothetical protein CCP3SC1_1200009 [Gammaproteobacteria bacterium]
MVFGLPVHLLVLTYLQELDELGLVREHLGTQVQMASLLRGFGQTRALIGLKIIGTEQLPMVVGVPR